MLEVLTVCVLLLWWRELARAPGWPVRLDKVGPDKETVVGFVFIHPTINAGRERCMRLAASPIIVPPYCCKSVARGLIWLPVAVGGPPAAVRGRALWKPITLLLECTAVPTPFPLTL